jgi:hypothetical protein
MKGILRSVMAGAWGLIACSVLLFIALHLPSGQPALFWFGCVPSLIAAVWGLGRRRPPARDVQAINAWPAAGMPRPVQLQRRGY